MLMRRSWRGLSNSVCDKTLVRTSSELRGVRTLVMVLVRVECIRLMSLQLEEEEGV